MKIVALDGYTENPGDLSWGELGKLDEPTVYDRTNVTDENKIISRIGDAGVVIINKTPVAKNIMDAYPGIKYITMLTTGYSVMDCACAREKGIPLSNMSSYETASVGRFVIAILLELCHHVAHHSQTVHEGKWGHCQDWCYWDYPLIELDGRIMGIIGFKRTEQQTGKITKAMGMSILAYGSYPDGSGRGIAEYVNLDTLYAKSDAIALRYPLFPETQGIINKDAIAKMKDGVMILNNSHDPLIVEQDLADALSPGRVSGAGLDVVSTEPIEGGNPLLKARNCIIAPRTSWTPKESRQGIVDHTVENVKAYFADAPIHVVNW